MVPGQGHSCSSNVAIMFAKEGTPGGSGEAMDELVVDGIRSSCSSRAPILVSY